MEGKPSFRPAWYFEFAERWGVQAAGWAVFPGEARTKHTRGSAKVSGLAWLLYLLQGGNGEDLKGMYVQVIVGSGYSDAPKLKDFAGQIGSDRVLWLLCFAMGVCTSVRVWILNNDIISVFSATDPLTRDIMYTCVKIMPLIAIALFARYRPAMLDNRVLSCAAVVSTLGGAVMFLCLDIWSIPGWAQAAYALCIFGGMWVSVAFALSLCKLANQRSVALCICSAYAVGSALEWGMTFVPLQLRVVVWAVLTCIILAMAYPFAGEMIERASEMGSPRDLALTQPRSFVGAFNMVFCSLFAFKLVTGFSLALNSVSGVPVHTFGTGLVLLLVGAYILMNGRERGQEDMLFQLASLLVIAGILAAMVSVLYPLGFASNVLLASAGEFFTLLQMLVVVSMAARNKIDGVYVATCAQAFISTGMMLGAATGHAANDMAAASGATTLAFLAILLFLFVTFCFVWFRRASFESIIYGIQPVKPLVVAHAALREEGHESLEDRCARLAKEHALTKRETEIMTMLARGRNGKFIEEHYVVSYNTVKTHVKHIYMKLDVHSQQELIDVVEEVGAESVPRAKDGLYAAEPLHETGK